MKLFSENRRNPFFWAFLGLALVLLFLMPILALDAGNSGDEDKFQIPQGYNILRYYQTGGEDTTCLSFENLKYYGSSFDYWTALVAETFHIENIAANRHIANAFMGWLCVLFVGLIAYRQKGWGAGVLAMLLMFLSPRFLGHSFNNPKDIPLAAGTIMAIYYIMMFFRQASDRERKMPKVSTMLMLVLSLVIAVSTRIGGLIIVGFFGLWGILWIIANRQCLELPKVLKTAGWALLVCLAGFFLGILRWPYAMQAPIANSIDSYHAMSQFAIGIRQIFEGQHVMSDALPWYYTPKFILMTVPLVVLLGWLLSLGLGWEEKGMARMEKIMLLFCFIFPVFWIVCTKANVYGGWRHSLFAYPAMVVSAACGFIALIQKFGKSLYRYIAIAVIALLMFLPTRHIVANHPYEYVYFNELSGGPKKAFGQYEMDYYYHSMRECTEWVMEHAAQYDNLQPSGDKIVVGTWLPEPTRYFLQKDSAHFRHQFVRWYQRGNYDWDFLVFPITGISPSYLRNDKVFPPKETVHMVEVDGVPIGLVLKREDKNDFIASQLLQQGLTDSALHHYRLALEYNPYNETALMDVAEIYLQQGKLDSCQLMCERYKEFEPYNSQANYFIAYAYLLSGQTDQCVAACQEIKQHNPKFSGAYNLLLQIYLKQQNIYGAEAEIMQMIDNDLMDNQTMGIYVQLKQAQGIDERSAVRSLYGAIAKSLEKRGKKEQAQQYRQMLSQI